MMSIWTVVAAALLALLAPAELPAGPPSRLADMPTGRIAVDGHAFDVRIARTPEHRSAGFQYVEPGRMSEVALLFRYRRPVRPSFHMHNVARPLMLAWIAPDGRVLDVIRMLPESRGHVSPARISAVLEYTADHPLAARIRPGMRLSILDED